MKRSIKIYTMLLVLVTFFSSVAMANEKRKEETITLKVEMDCEMCVKKIESNIPYERGVRDLKVSLEKGECEVTYRTKHTSVEELIESFNKLGYPAKLKKSGEKETENKENKSEDKETHENHNH
jgi:copper chaperone CopZ